LGAALLTLAAPVVASPAGATGPAGAGSQRPFVAGAQTVPTYSYESAIRESISVETPLDSDRDGVPDRVMVDLVRPREAAAAGVKVPVIMEASPYYQCCGRGNESEIKEYGPDGTVTSMPLYYDNYFVPRGYAFAAVDLTGTARSSGCGDVGGPAEVLGARAAIDWLNGRARGFHSDGSAAVADWTTGKVGMIGKSWDASIANGVAATGVPGLTTIVPIAGISSWYDYTRFNGVLRSGGYVDFLANLVGGQPPAVCGGVFDDAQAASDDSTGDLNQFWDERDYRPSAGDVHASVFVVHGLNDLNVTTNQFATWWSLLAARDVPRHIWLSQQGHVDPFDFRRADWVDELHRWFDYWLQGLDNGVMAEPQAQVERADGQWAQQAVWPAAGAARRPIFLGSGDGGTGTLSNRPSHGTRILTDDFNQDEAGAVADPSVVRPHRLVFLSGALSQPLHLSGSASVTLRVQVDKPTTELSVRLVDYGSQTRVNYDSRGEGISTLRTESCWGESTATDNACYRDTAPVFITSDTDVLARGWQDAAHYRSLRSVTPLQPGVWYAITVPVDATDATIAAGHVLGLVVSLSDNEFSSPNPTDATVTVDLAGSLLTIPAVGPAILPIVTVAPTVHTSTSLTAGASPDSRLAHRQPQFR
jgi:X-Pro dipeptidyl-peptidase